MSRAYFYSLVLFLALGTFVLAACTGIPPAAQPVEQPAISAANTEAISKTVAILVVDYYADSRDTGGENGDTSGGAADSTPEGANSPNCLTDMHGQVYWITWVVGEIVPPPTHVAGGEPDQEAINHGDLVFTELADYLGKKLKPDDETPFDGRQLIYRQGANNFLVRRVPIHGHTTQAVRDSIQTEVDMLSSEGITDFVINMSFVLIPCEPPPAQSGLSAQEQANFAIATLNTVPPIQAGNSDDLVASPLAVYLNNQLYDTLKEAGATLENYDRVFLEPPHILTPGAVVPWKGYYRIEVQNNTAPVLVKKFGGDDLPTTADLFNRANEPVSTYDTSANANYLGAVPGYAYDLNAVADGRIVTSPHVASPSGLLLNLGASQVMSTVIGLPMHQIPVTWTLLLTGTTPAVVTSHLQTAPALSPLRVLEAYADRSKVCGQFVEQSANLQEYCNSPTYGEQISDASTPLVQDDPLYQLLQSYNDSGLRVISIGAAGNFSAPYPYAPANWPGVISVGATENPYFVGNQAEVQMTGTVTLTSVLRGVGEVVDNRPVSVAGTSFAAPLLSVLAAEYLAGGGALDCSGADGVQTARPPLNYATWEPDQPPTYGNWQNLPLAAAREKYCALFPNE